MAFFNMLFNLYAITFALADRSPMFLWGANSIVKPALTSVTQNELISMVEPNLENKALVVFLENALTKEDFLCEIENESCLIRLGNVMPKNYYTSVIEPVQTLKSLQATYVTLTIDKTTYLNDIKQLLKSNKIIFVNFDNDITDSRALLLKDHDSIMNKIYKELKDKALFIYTTTSTISPKKIRQQRDVALGNTFRDEDRLLLHFDSLKMQSGNTETEIKVTSMTIEPNNNKTSMLVKLSSTSEEITFNINLSDGYFYMTNVRYKGVNFYVADVSAPTSFSYFCGNLTLRNNTELLKWNGLQFQAPFGTIKDKNFPFGDPWHCVGFFSGGILMGLLIVALLLSILFTGLCWIKDINTMDRFDDPKGKTITISATD